MAHLHVSGVVPAAAVRVRRYDDRASGSSANVFDAALPPERRPAELLDRVLHAALALLDIDVALVCTEEGSLVAAAPNDEAALESARPFARVAIRALGGEAFPDGLYVARLTEAPPAYVALRWRAGAAQRVDLADALATTCASLLHSDGLERVVQQTDALTGLALRMPTLRQLENAIHLSRRANARCAFLYLDLDGFKGVNDSYGHAAGDRVLSDVGRRMRACVRRGDTAGRLGGDEFGVVVAMHDGENDVLEAAERLLGALRLRDEVGEAHGVSASIGIAIFPDDGSTVTELIEHADAAMYAAKRSGGDAIRFYRDGVLYDARTRRAFAAAFAGFDGERDLRISYAPIVDAPTNEIVAVEAHARWRHPEHGWLDLTPARGTVEIDALVIATALAENRRLGPAFAVHVNLSAIDDAIADVIEALPPEDARRLAIEVPESTLLAAPEIVARVFARAQRAGVSVGIDGFGSATVSVDALCAHALDYVKIDRRLSHGAGTERGARLFRAAMDLVRRFEAQPIVAGVERGDPRTVLTASGVRQVAGDAVGPAMTAHELGMWLSSRRAEPLW